MAYSRPLSPIRVLVLFGGRSAEHEVSCLSATHVLAAIDRDRYRVTMVGITRDGRWTLVDAVPEGGDGMPTGADVAASAVGIDKRQMKNVFTARGLPQVPYISLRRWRIEQDPVGVVDQIEEQLAYPMFTKPARQGSSIGIRKVRNRKELVAGIDEALEYDRSVLVEQGLEEPRELECGVLGNTEIEVTPPGEILTSHEFYDYEGKYLDDVQLRCPADVPDAVRDECMDLARRAYLAIGARGMARVDFFYADGRVLVNEINTIPGFTSASMFPYVWATQGVAAPQLVDRLLSLALEAADSEAKF